MGNQKVFDQILLDIGYPRDLDEIPPDISLEECCFEQSDKKAKNVQQKIQISEKQVLSNKPSKPVMKRTQKIK